MNNTEIALHETYNIKPGCEIFELLWNKNIAYYSEIKLGFHSPEHLQYTSFRIQTVDNPILRIEGLLPLLCIKPDTLFFDGEIWWINLFWLIPNGLHIDQNAQLCVYLKNIGNKTFTVKLLMMKSKNISRTEPNIIHTVHQQHDKINGKTKEILLCKKLLDDFLILFTDDMTDSIESVDITILIYDQSHVICKSLVPETINPFLGENTRHAQITQLDISPILFQGLNRTMYKIPIEKMWRDYYLSTLSVSEIRNLYLTVTFRRSETHKLNIFSIEDNYLSPHYTLVRI